MKTITGRQNIARAINLSGKPVAIIDLDNKEYMFPDDESHWVCKGSKIRVSRGTFNTGEPWYDRTTLHVYSDSEKDTYTLFDHDICLSAEVHYSDIVEKAEYAQAPIVHDGDHVIIVELHSRTNEYTVKEGVVTLNGEFVSPAGYIK